MSDRISAIQDFPPVWNRIIGQEPLVRLLDRVCRCERDISQSWLICGAEGSGRTELAHAFAMALNCSQHGCGQCETCHLIESGTHPDVTVVRADQGNVSIDRVRELIDLAEQLPSVAPWRIIIIEDCERMLERTTNVLLKSVEEPSPRTIWILCASSAHAVLPTIRSRTRIVQLAVASMDAVAHYVCRTTGVSQSQARMCARLAQSNISVAQLYATNPEALQLRTEIIDNILSLTRASQAVLLADIIVTKAQEQAQSIVDKEIFDKQNEFRRIYGLGEKDSIPSMVRSQYNALSKKEDMNRRVTRLTRDVLDRCLITIASIFRDICVVHNEAQTHIELINAEHVEGIHALAQRMSVDKAMKIMQYIDTAGRRIHGNTPVLLAMEALLTSIVA